MKLSSMFVAVAAALGGFMQRRGLTLGLMAVELDKAEHAKLPKDVQTLYVEKDGKYHLDLPPGFEDVTKVKGALEKEREARKTAEQAAKDLAKKFEGLDADELRKLLEKLGGDEEAALLKAGKFDEAFAKRTIKLQQAHAKALDEVQKKIDAANVKGEKYAQRVLDNHIRAAATKAGLHTHAVDDALFRARALFKLTEEGEPVQLGDDGKPVMGKDGKTPFAPLEWLEGMKTEAPHWYPSGNAGGGSGGPGKQSGATMKRSEFEALDPVARAAKAAEAGKGTLKIVD